MSRDRADIAHHPCMMLVEPEDFMAAARSGALPLPPEVRAWVLHGADLPA